jgi:hypothetical protein
VNAIPLLGSGKPDYVAATALARQRLGSGKPLDATQALAAE